MSRRAKRRKMALEEDAGETRAVQAAIRSAKKAGRPTKIGLPEARPLKPGKSKSKEKRKEKTVGRKGLFDSEIGGKRKQSHSGAQEGARAKRSDTVKGFGKKGVKGKSKAKR